MMMLSVSTSCCSLLRQALPVLAQLQSSNSLLSPPPPPIRPPNPTFSLLLRSTSSCSHVPLRNTHDSLLFSTTSSTPLRRFSTRATHNVNDPGSIDLPLVHSMEKKIKEQLSAESVTVKDAYGDGRHVSINVVSTAFEGQSAVNRQRMVYKAIWEELQSTVHAVDQMTTSTPAEVAARNDKSSWEH